MKLFRLTTDSKKYFAVRCLKCYWQGCSSKTFGGQPIADTGDYSEIECPKCSSIKLNDDAPDIINPFYSILYLLKKPVIWWEAWRRHKEFERWEKEVFKDIP